MFDTRHRRRPTIAVVLAALAVVLIVAVGTAVALWVTGDSDDTPTAGGTDAGFTIDPVGTDPIDVATVVMAGVFTWQPAVQDSTWNALHTQAGHLTGPMATAAAQAPSQAPKPISDWAAWACSGDTLTAVVRTDGDTTVDGDTATVPVTIAQTVQHQSGQATPYSTYTARVILNDITGEWKVSNYLVVGIIQ
ncbi:hypothetical protein HQ325_03150 [Rhodococcus sp. BP-349]|uniref:hypothetical protein n=1 Tax=unclassified Rhodococcus (in: high G+C Gram-positive bacteria) TaxID=192944 RepID=UPI001C9A70F4|nr:MULTISPECIES: hypothetical protein [unclassified Rhodococcus (in: high G+C Gram-positive bacteria)]MBY6537661.1 hypothetical protein [Rhodococcus sp. BP-363]MBY6541998.1 hypothetical protein [Rhodococcus sp. BP-369]MBY6561228.1 hypothetical protein [Rhodococcus sp. BP-370]MBY6575520.1 hypothetical protein [Rhodococcus sp. BP-364]MBY6584821.1 hypothetical protein [Rhodococcus sp. BP-358]